MTGAHDEQGWREPRAEALAAAATGMDNRLKAALLGLAMLGAASYPLLLGSLLGAFGVRSVAAALALFAVASAIGRQHDSSGWIVFARGVAIALAGTSVVTGSAAPLLLVPSFVYAVLGAIFFASLAGDVSLVERGARLIQPVAPDFIAGYCRRVTALWGALLLGHGVVLAIVAVFATQGTWRAAAGAYTWAGIAAVSAAEFLVRKTYFRNYWYGGPFDRLWARLFPADATPMGRRSAAYIRMVREKLAGLDSQP